MKISKTIILIAAILTLSIVNAATVYDDPAFVPYRKGLTYVAKQWPSKANYWTGQMGCSGCDPINGDTSCTVSLPILCILHYRVIDRPYYAFTTDSTYTNPDNGFYNPWTGGIFVVTDPFQGVTISSYAVGDQHCKDYYGPKAKFAEFHDGYFMDIMNTPPIKAWKSWDWALTQCGEFSLWGYFNHHWRGNTWVWINNQPNGNCGNI